MDKDKGGRARHDSGASTSASEPASRLLTDVVSFSANISSSVLIIFINKRLMDPTVGYGFMFATSLCALHFFASAAFVKGLEYLGFSEPASMPLRDTIGFAAIAATSISTMNMSLLFNNVGFYQIAKLLIIPAVCVIEYAMLGKRLSLGVIGAIIIVIIGVSIVTVSDASINIPGLVVAMVSVVSAAMQQVMCGFVQRKCGVTSNQLLSNTAPWQGGMLVLVGPMLDQQLSHKWVLSYQFHGHALSLLALSCCVAVMVNISQFMCLGRFSAVTFTVLGHGKTIMVLLIGWAYLGEVMTSRKLGGMMLAIFGMLLYAYLMPAPGSPGTGGGSGTGASAGLLSGGLNGKAGTSEHLPLLASSKSQDVETGERRHK